LENHSKKSGFGLALAVRSRLSKIVLYLSLKSVMWKKVTVWRHGTFLCLRDADTSHLPVGRQVAHLW